ncbi:TadE family type IV pilus minor pilin, partial [Nocardioides sp. CER28]
MSSPARDRGAATAELVMVLPALVAVTIGLVWLLSVGAAQVRTVDAARETARALARG